MYWCNGEMCPLREGCPFLGGSFTYLHVTCRHVTCTHVHVHVDVYVVTAGQLVTERLAG